MFGLDTKKLAAAFEEFNRQLDELKANPSPPTPQARLDNIERLLKKLKDSFS